MATGATIQQFLSEIASIVTARDGAKLQSYLIVEPPYGTLYNNMIDEMRRHFPAVNEAALETKISDALPHMRESDDEPPWSAFNKLILQYLTFLRDVDTKNLLETYNLLSELVQ